MNKTAIKNFAVWARRQLISDITYKAGMLGITESGIAQPLKQSTKDLQFFDIGTRDYAEVSGAQIRQRNALIEIIRTKEKASDYKTAFQTVIEEVAYTWFNRLIAIRFMEVNEYLPSNIRVLSSENPDKLEPDFVTTPFDTDMEFSPYEKDIILQLKEDNKLDELFRMLFIKQCNKLGEILPELFEQTLDYSELLLTLSFTDKDGVIYHLTHDISEYDFNVEKEGQVEIIGWMYQYYNTEPKDEVFALLKKNVKITKERIPAATQLFTPDWIVRYMVENSLGRLWVEGHPNDELKSNWKYYLEEAEQEADVKTQLDEIRREYAQLTPEEIKVIDPCMGSGHILVYMFDVLMQIYESQGYIQRDAAKSILINNLYGIDIDKRAYQLAYFAVMMKARQYSRRILTEGIKPNLMAVQGSPKITRNILSYLGEYKNIGERLLDDFTDAEEYGSILNIEYTKEELDAIDKKLDEVDAMADYGNLIVQMESIELVQTLAPLVRQARIMGQKYDVVVTNPPYMGLSNGNLKLNEFVKHEYPNSKADLCTCFMERCIAMNTNIGYMAMINIPAWMSLVSFEKLRLKLLSENTIVSLVHFGRGVFGSDFGSVAFVLSKRHISQYNGSYLRLFDRPGAVDTVETKEQLYLERKQRYFCCQDLFKIAPGCPISYWLSINFFNTFRMPQIGEKLTTREGMATADNEHFLRLWFEVALPSISFSQNDPEVADDDTHKWFPYNKGGDYRKWYGNHNYVVNWENNGFEIKHNYDSGTGRLRSHNYNGEYAFRPGLTWTSLSISSISVRRAESGFLFDSKGAMGFASKEEDIYRYIALLNSCVGTEYLKIFSPTVDFKVGDVAQLPDINGNETKINDKTITCINISKTDWNSFETSWNFTLHPFLKYRGLTEEERTCVTTTGETYVCCPVGYAYAMWMLDCDERFNALKAKEEELNRIFIDIYGLQDELTPKVEDKDVTVRKADMQRDIKSFISYAVGCMFGRYSIDTPGLAYAGGEWDGGKYVSFIPDKDNCIPITDEEYFQDDIVTRFVEFVRVVYGVETLEENLDFIADALGNKGSTSRQIIRNYFLNDFFKDHCQTYSVTGSGKRPIYWLFDSGKQNGFKALVYMHRWNADTVGNVRVEYLHKLQKIYEREMESCQDTIDNSLNNKEIAAATRRKEKLLKQQKECRDYDEKIAHIALNRIDIDLDDGVKINYRKVQTGSDGKFCEIFADSKDIMIKEDSDIWQNLISNR